MAIGMLIDVPGGTQQLYDRINETMFGTSDPPPSDMPDGLIFHTAGATAEGWRIFDVWESREQFERFFEDRVVPAMQQVAGPDAGGDESGGPQIHELYRLERRETA
jgi:hypothetical protein